MIYVTNCNIGMTGGGDAVVAMEILNSLSLNGFDVAAISRRYEIPANLAEDLSGIKNITFPFIPVKEKYVKQKFGSVRYLLKKVQSDFYLTLLNRQLSKNPPKLIIANDLMTGRYLLDRFQNQVKTIQVVHAHPEFFVEFKGTKLDEYFDIFKKADHIIFVSEDCRRKWLAHDGFYKDKTYCIHNCANENLAKKYLSVPKKKVRKRLNMSSDKFYLTSVASFNYEKGLDLLLDAAPELAKIAPNLEILLIGSDKAEFTEYLKERVQNESLGFIKILGFKDNAMEYIYASDAFILPSRVEALGLVILEAMILKTPVIASSVGGIPELIDDEKSGLLFESENIDELIQCFKKIYLNQGDRNRYVEKASIKYWNNFSKEKFTDRYIELVNRLIN